jgi:hypothetical protein
MVHERRGHELAGIKLIVMLACPHEGSEYLASIRRLLRFGSHPQAENLQALNRDVVDAQRVVLQRIVNAATVTDTQCPIPIYVYSGLSDNIVPAVSAQSVFPFTAALPGDHSSILDPDAPGSATLETRVGSN